VGRRRKEGKRIEAGRNKASKSVHKAQRRVLATNKKKKREPGTGNLHKNKGEAHRRDKPISKGQPRRHTTPPLLEMVGK